MRIAILSRNLMWSQRLRSAAAALGHDVVGENDECDVALVALSETGFEDRIAGAAGTKVIGFAGHKEKELLNRGRELGCDVVVSNSELTNRFESVIEGALRAG